MKEIIAALNHRNVEGIAHIEVLNSFNHKIIDAGGDSMLKLDVMDRFACSTGTENGTIYCTLLTGLRN